MKILLHRHHIGDFASLGRLSIGGEYICDTCEHSQHCVPPGTYHIYIMYSKQFHRKMPFLRKAPGVCLAYGNGIYNCQDGRILLGTTIVPGCLKNSKAPFLLLYDRINHAIRRGQQVELIIEN